MDAIADILPGALGSDVDIFGVAGDFGGCKPVGTDAGVPEFIGTPGFGLLGADVNTATLFRPPLACNPVGVSGVFGLDGDIATGVDNCGLDPFKFGIFAPEPLFKMLGTGGGDKGEVPPLALTSGSDVFSFTWLPVGATFPGTMGLFKLFADLVKSLTSGFMGKGEACGVFLAEDTEFVDAIKSLTEGLVDGVD